MFKYFIPVNSHDFCVYYTIFRSELILTPDYDNLSVYILDITEQDGYNANLLQIA